MQCSLLHRSALNDYWLQLCDTPSKLPSGRALQISFALKSSMVWVVLRPYIGIICNCGCHSNCTVCCGQPKETHFIESKATTASIVKNCNYKHCSHQANNRQSGHTWNSVQQYVHKDNLNISNIRSTVDFYVQDDTKIVAS